MTDPALTQIDEALARGATRKRRQPVRPLTMIQPLEAHTDDASVDAGRPALLDRDVWPQIFFAIQFLWGIPLFLPDTQGIRFIVRALPYASGMLFLLLYFRRAPHGRLPRGGALVVAALLLLVLNLMHPTSALTAGVAQCVFQLSIAAPVFWLHKTVRSSVQLTRVLYIIFILNFLSAGLGMLQVYYPDRFMPPQFSAQLADDFLGSMTYVGADGRVITRPPGLTDTPGGASVAGGIAALLGFGLTLRTRNLWHALAIALMSAVSLASVYLTQARSVPLIAIGAAVVIGVITIRQGRIARASWGLGAAGAVIVASFLWASALGGASVEERFLTLRDQGALASYQQNRGDFLASTLGELLDQYPLGAGLGRWGMMETYFADGSNPAATHIHVEIQPTGWLLDGGIPMWFLYGGAIILSLFASLGLSFTRNMLLAECAPLVLGLQLFIAGMSMAGPAFNMQLGILFWAVAAAVHGAAEGDRRAEMEAGA
ncbi:MAG: hypothetical protein AB7H96_14465 [Vicinamibacterales bacterium]